MVLNNQLPIIVDTIISPQFDNLIFLKNVKLNQLPDQYINIAETLKLSLGKFDQYLFDLKIQDLNKDQVPCIPGWHVDNGPFHLAKYALVVWGSSKTEFYIEKMELPEEKNMKILCHNLNNFNLFPSFKLNDGEIIVYNNTNIHRGTPADYSGKRLLIRAKGFNRGEK